MRPSVVGIVAVVACAACKRGGTVEGDAAPSSIDAPASTDVELPRAVDVVTLQEKLMVSRVSFQSGVADLTLEKQDDTKDAAASR